MSKSPSSRQMTTAMSFRRLITWVALGTGLLLSVEIANAGDIIAPADLTALAPVDVKVGQPFNEVRNAHRLMQLKGDPDKYVDMDAAIEIDEIRFHAEYWFVSEHVRAVLLRRNDFSFDKDYDPCFAELDKLVAKLAAIYGEFDDKPLGRELDGGWDYGAIKSWPNRKLTAYAHATNGGSCTWTIGLHAL